MTWLEKLKTAPGVTPELIGAVKTELGAKAVVALLENGSRVFVDPKDSSKLIADCLCCVEKMLAAKKTN